MATKPDNRLPTFLRPDESRRLLNAATNQRDRLLCATMLGMGLRVGEAVKLRIEDVDLDNRTCFINQGKGKKDAYVRIPLQLTPWFHNYYTHTGTRHGWLFPSTWTTKTHMSRHRAEDIVTELCTAAGITRLGRRVTAHALRHTYATDLLRAGVDIVTVAQMMRHDNVKTTLIYLHCVTEHLAVHADKLQFAAGQGRLWAIS